jgi:23S rRNA (pseudouridine1915-N3)-methyltransferase
VIKIIAVGKMSHKALDEMITYYLKQCPIKMDIVEIDDVSTDQGIQIEGEKILAKIKPADDVIALAIKGTQYSSESFAQLLDHKMTYQSKDIVFVIGGSNGLSNQVIERANQQVSFSKMTFPHQLMRLILVEQIYRALMILKNHPYHK